MKRVSGFVFLVPAILLLIAACGEKNENKTETLTKKSEPAAPDSLAITVYGADGKSILELTKEDHAVDYVESSMGAFVKGIDSVESGGGYNWFISVNDSMIQVASDKYITKDGDTVRWHFRKI